MLNTAFIGSVRRIISSPNAPAVACKMRAGAGPNRRTQAKIGRNVMDELPEFPPTLIVSDRDSDSNPRVTRARSPAQASAGRPRRDAQSTRSREPTDRTTTTATYVRTGPVSIHKTPLDLMTLPACNAVVDQRQQRSEKIEQRAEQSRDEHIFHLLSGGVSFLRSGSRCAPLLPLRFALGRSRGSPVVSCPLRARFRLCPGPSDPWPEAFPISQPCRLCLRRPPPPRGR